MHTYPSAVASFVASYRRQHGFTLDAVATAGREFGAGWGTASIRNIEAGRLAPTIPTLLILALALGKLSGEPLKLSDLLGDVDYLDLPTRHGGEPVPRDWVNRMLAGAPVDLASEAFMHDDDEAPDRDLGDEFDEELEVELSQKMRKMDGRELTEAEKSAQFAQALDELQMPPENTSFVAPPETASLAEGRVAATASLAEERAAAKLGIEPIELQRWAVRLWSRSLEEESARRAGPGKTPQARGRVTRVLVDEIRAVIEKEE